MLLTALKPFLIAAVACCAAAGLQAAIAADQVIDGSTAAEVPAEAKADAVDGIFAGSSSGTVSMLTFVGFAVILAAIAGAVWFLAKRGLLRKPFNKGDGKLKVAETRMLGNRQFIMVVEYEEQKILLGVGPGKIDYLTNLGNYQQSFPQVAPNVSFEAVAQEGRA